ncbi:hypothetical protein D7Z54_01345 [Salibacterium salarium]|uniref:Uncharacterized protein n=1 Tax=Salibacterium salarium TaxID=284579 RepID=A0A428NA07_9BACI|nr:hypothetical protein D7Z54_01345 [Salibacterium salarium]
MQQDSLNSGNKQIGLIIALIMLSCILIFDVYLFFENTAIVAKLLATGSFILLMFLLIPFYIQAFKNVKKSKKFT